MVVFDNQTSRAGAHARAFLKNWRGHLMVDDYAGYKVLFTAGPTELACLAHIRRKFFDVHAASGSGGAAINVVLTMVPSRIIKPFSARCPLIVSKIWRVSSFASNR